MVNIIWSIKTVFGIWWSQTFFETVWVWRSDSDPKSSELWCGDTIETVFGIQFYILKKLKFRFWKCGTDVLPRIDQYFRIISIHYESVQYKRSSTKVRIYLKWVGIVSRILSWTVKISRPCEIWIMLSRMIK